MTSVSLTNVQKSYGDVHVIMGADLQIADGEFLVLVGPSGCGKSTLLRMVAGLEDISSGTLKIGDVVVNDVPPRDRGVAMVFQSYALYPHMTVRENMGFGLMIRKETQSLIDERVGEAAKLLDIEDYLERLPKNLSGGQRQRVAIGRAIVRQPDVFLFDEPLSNLDAALRTQMRVELKKLHQRLKATMLYVTHDQVEAMTLADRIAVVNKGLIQQVGSPTELYESPQNRFVAGFIGSPGMNFISVSQEGTLLAADGVKVPGGEYGADTVEIGVRPQHLEFESKGGEASFKGVVEVLEPMGWEAHVHMRVGDLPFVVHARAEDIVGTKPGDELELFAAPEHLHYFDAKGTSLRS